MFNEIDMLKGIHVDPHDDVADALSNSSLLKLSPNSGNVINIFYDGLESSYEDLARFAVKNWQEYSGLTFNIVSASDNADIVVTTHENDATYVPGYDTFTQEQKDRLAETRSALRLSADGTVSVDEEIDQSIVFIDPMPHYTQEEIIHLYTHEIGHALGLEHPDIDSSDSLHYDDDPFTWNSQINPTYDTKMISAMSYLSPRHNPNVPDYVSGYVDPLTPMIADIQAIRKLYGTESAASFSGDTIYGNGSTGFAWADMLGQNTASSPVTVFDTDGWDAFILNHVTDDNIIDLRPGYISSIGGSSFNVIITTDTIIEEVSAGSSSDLIYGNDAANILTGNGGDDIIFMGGSTTVYQGNINSDIGYGGSGSDFVGGGNGEDVISGGEGSDILCGDVSWMEAYFGIGNDYNGTSGNDTLIGGDYGTPSDPEMDVFLFSGNFGHDSILDFDSKDLIVIDVRLSGEQIDGSSINKDGMHIQMGQNSISITGADPGNMKFSQSGNFAWFGSSPNVIESVDVPFTSLEISSPNFMDDQGNQFFMGSSANETFHVYESNVAYGRGGDDALFGNGSSQHLRGGSGADFFYGGAGDDYFVAGDSTSFFDGDQDSFFFRRGDGLNDEVDGFETGIDRAIFEVTEDEFLDFMITPEKLSMGLSFYLDKGDHNDDGQEDTVAKYIDSTTGEEISSVFFDGANLQLEDLYFVLV